LDEDAGFFFIYFAQFFPSGNGFIDPISEWLRLPDAAAIAADSTEIRESIRERVLEARHGLRQHDRQGIFACAARPGKDQRRRHPFCRDRLSQVTNRIRIPRKLMEAHVNETSKDERDDKFKGRFEFGLLNPLKPKDGLYGPPACEI